MELRDSRGGMPLREAGGREMRTGQLIARIGRLKAVMQLFE